MSANGKTPFLTPQQELFLANYTNPKSETFSNAYQSAKKAGYAEEYSQNITHEMPEWLSENIGLTKLYNKAVKALDKTLEDDYDEREVLIDGIPSGISKREPRLSKIKQDSAKFVASTIGKSKFATKGEEGAEKLAQAITGMKIQEDKDDVVES